MNPPLNAYRNTATPPSHFRRLEVATLDVMIFAVEKAQSPNLVKRVRLAWQFFDRQSPLRQAALFAGMGLLAFCLGLIKGAF